MSPAGDSATVTVRVNATPRRAFELFTGELDLWWRRGRRFRNSAHASSTLVLEPGLGGRLLETYEAGSGPRTVEFGRVTAWEPPERLALEWRNTHFTSDQVTLVEVTFRASGAGALVTVRHSGWSALPDDHPARHGQVGADFARGLGLWWGDLLTALRERGDASPAP